MLKNEQRSVLVKGFTFYVNHSYMLIRHSRHEYYRDSNMLKAMDKLILARNYFTTQSSSLEICRWIIRLEKELRLVLPHNNNDSFFSSLEKLEFILSQSKHIVHESEIICNKSIDLAQA